MCRLLLVEDDQSLIDGLEYTLTKNGYQVDVAKTLEESENLYRKNAYELLILDVSLPDGSGYSLCQQVRKTSTVPILFLTAADEEVQIVKGLDMGGDDYMTKPFKLGELLSRIKALLRRAGQFGAKSDSLESNGVRIALKDHRAFLENQPLDLTAAEYRLLCYFLENPNQILTREQILNQLWDGQGNYIDDNTLSVYVRRLRNKVESEPSHPQKLLTIRGFGYQWKEV